MTLCPPADEVGQVESITPQSVPSQTTDTTLVQKTIDPAHLASGGLSDDAKRALCAAKVDPIDQRITHECALSSSD
jgi:hypothetical protein